MQRIKHDKPCTDHLGNHFDNIKSMCAYWNIRTATFSRRMSVYHMSLEEALTKPVKNNGGLVCHDHLGEKFYSKTSMCNHWGIDRKLYDYRIAHGWTVEEALAIPPKILNSKKAAKD